MDNLTHSLFALTLARTPLGRAGRGATTALVLASNAPDVDIVATVGGTLGYLEWHRGPTHGPFGVVLLGLAAAALVWFGRWIVDSRRAAEYRSFGSLAAVSIVGVLGHVLMDLPTSYGTRLLSPFLWRWYGFDLMPIIDPYLLAALAAGLLAGRGSAAWRGRHAAIVLVFMMANYGVRAYSHGRALDIAPQAFGPALPAPCDEGRHEGDRESNAPMPWIDRWPRDRAGETRSGPQPLRAARCLIELAAFPDFLSPFRWRLLAHTSSAYEIRDVDILDRRAQGPASSDDAPWRLSLHVPNHWTPAVHRAAASEVGRVFLGFSRFPAVRTTTHAGVTTVRWDDLRFNPRPRPRPQNDPRGSFFSATVRINQAGVVIEQTLGP
jgi:membrane-bound metal-dependent hydrolase YbcI (DUF457 family)